MDRSKFGFLPAFFTTLAIVFCIALWLRLRTYRDATPVTTSGRANATQAGAASVDERLPISRMPNATAAAEVTRVTTTTASVRRTRKEPIPFVPPPPSAKATATTPKSPTSASSSAAAKPSFFSRLVSPIVDAFKSATKPSQTAGGSGTPSQTTGGGHAGQTGTGGSTGTNGTADPNDPNSDTQPPALVAISFNPATIKDGEQTVMTIQATDNLSGVRSVSGTIAAPSGAVQGFACQRMADTDQYTATISVPREAAEGVWKVNYLSLIDNASNAATLNATALPPTASFRVASSSSDTSGPTLKAVWLDKLAIKAGEKDTVFVDAEDDKSGVNLVSGVFISPAKHARIGFVCRPGEGATWSGDLSTPSCIDCGDWQLEQLQLQDKANNMTTIRSDNPLVANVRVNISGDRCDSTAPEINSLVLDRNAVSNAQDSVISVTVMASDDVCGIMSISGQVTGPATGGGAPRLYFSFTSGGDPQTWVGRITVPKLAAKGAWRISWIQVLDQAHNLKTYAQGDPALINAAFNVQ